MKRILSHLRENTVAYLALFVALGGTSYAAANLPAGSVGNAQLKNHSVSAIKLDPRSIGAYVRAWAVIENGNHVVASRPRARVVSWDPSFGSGVVSWGRAISKGCFPLADGGGDFIQAAVLPGPRHVRELHYQVFNSSGHFDPTGVVIDVAVLCSQP
jgi:hypothetical protein